MLPVLEAAAHGLLRAFAVLGRRGDVVGIAGLAP